jgi:predicted nucleotidyltransferase
MIEVTLKQKLVNAIVMIAPPKLIVLFGSEAYGTPREDSDIDLAVIAGKHEVKEVLTVEVLPA